MDPELEIGLRKRAEPLLLKGRNGDLDHTLRAVSYARQLLEKEAGNPDVVIPALYLHDIGWGRVDYTDFQNAPPAQKKNARSVLMHMRHSAEMAEGILRDMGWDPAKRREITEIIAVHDDPDKAFAMDNPSAVLVVEADRLDRYGPDSFDRYKRMFGEQSLNGDAFAQARDLRRTNLTAWFKTPTARALAQRLGRESGWLDG